MSERRKIRMGGITRRWISVSLVFMIVVLGVGSTAIILSTRSSYYVSAQQTLEYHTRYVVSSVPSAGSTMAREMALRDIVENFADKDRYEVMLIGSNGKVISTSNGFEVDPNEPLDDYSNAVSSGDGRGAMFGESVGGEHIIAVTQLLSKPAGDIEAIRFVSSLEKVDDQLQRNAQMVIVICLVIIVFTILTGIYFVRSIVVPLGEIGKTARRITSGDFDVRIDKKYNDEIGDLSEIINDMAAGLSASDQLKNDFVSSVSHELRTPLTAIRGWGETLQNPKIGRDAFDKGMTIILNETERLSILVEDLLDFSRLQSGRTMNVELKPIHLGDVLREAVEIYDRRAKSLGLKLSYKNKADKLDIQGDFNRLMQVFSNLIDNAIKYSGAKGTIQVLAQNVDNRVRVQVIDCGIGIPPDEIDHVTERFYKARNAVTGSGIGLAVAKEIIEKHSGTLLFTSEINHGTTATIELPLRQ